MIKSLVEFSVNEHVYYTTDRYIEFAKICFAKGMNDWRPLIDFIESQRWTLSVNDSHAELWVSGWNRVLDNVREGLMDQGPDVVKSLPRQEWERLKQVRAGTSPSNRGGRPEGRRAPASRGGRTESDGLNVAGNVGHGCSSFALESPP